MEKVTVTSEKYAINWKDTLKGLLVAVGTSVIVIVQASLDAGSLQFNWKQIVMAALAAGIAYLAKNFFTPASVHTRVSDKKESDLPK